ncbi:MAG TPA: class I SAM-dependent RNA methyltransferase [Aliidongia sp.]|nr:class I SAM-dependent RNA methyltransferase [Aliidongia sp.]
MPGDLLIHELGPKGDGVHRSQGGIVYVDRALPGDRVQATVRRDIDGILRGDLLKLVKASPHRVNPPCPNYAVCGSCTLQHAKDEFYRHWKIDLVREALRGRGLKPRVWREPIFLAAGDRRRATFAAHKKGDTVILGHYRRRAHQVTDIAHCLVADPAIMEMRGKLTTALAPILQEGKPAMAFIQAVNGQLDLVITGPVGKKGHPDPQIRDALAKLARDTNANRISWRAGPDNTAEIIAEISPPRARFGALDVILPPLAFLQPTQAGEDALVAAVMELLPRTGKFADLFSGCGTFTGAMLERGAVDAYESVGPAVRALDKARGTRPLRAIRRDLFLNPLRRDEANRYDAIVFDPPRAGAQEQARMLASSRTPLLVGVSCNPATFARDARILVDGGYRLDSVRVVDQFAWSHHVELVAAFTKRGGVTGYGRGRVGRAARG